MGKIVAVHRLEEHLAAVVKKAAPGWEFASGIAPENLRQELAGAEILLGWNKLAGEVLLKEGTTLKWVQNFGAGVEQLPLDRFRELGITLTNASGVHPFQISEQIFAFLLSFTRQLHTAVRNQSTRKWGVPEKGLGEAHGKTMGILGVGAIGSETARLAKAFGMKVVGLRRSGKPDEWVDRMYDMNGLMELLPQCDYVVNCLPHTPDTDYLLGKEQFAAMKPEAVYINIGRGRTTDTAALIEALNAGRIAGAGLDVFEEEPLPEDHPLWVMDNVIITPHNAGFTPGYNERLISIFCDNLKRYLNGQDVNVNVVDLVHQY